MTFWVAGAVVVSSAIGAGAAGDAADASAEGTAATVGENRRQFDIVRSDTELQRKLGNNALQTLYDRTMAGPSQQQIQMDPGYQFGLSEGQRAMDRQFAASGGRISGAAMRRGARYATDYATTGYNSAYQRRQDDLNRLSALAGMGQVATGASAAAGSQAAGAIGQAYANQADTTAAARLYQGNTWQNAGNQLAALYQRNQRGGQPQGYGPYSGAGYQNGSDIGFMP